MMVDSIAAGLCLIAGTIVLGIIWGMSRKIDRLEGEVEKAQELTMFTLEALTAHLAGQDVTIETATMPLRETEIEE